MAFYSIQISQFSSLFTDVSLETGIYDIATHTPSEVTFLVNAPSKSKARCDMESDGGGWTVLVRRTPDVDGRVNFARKWAEYENGFGNLSTEFWYGLKLMHDLTSREPMEVQVEVKKSGQPTRIFSYGKFRVDGPDTLYTLHVSDAKQGGFDPFAHHNERKFSTAERDNDNHGTNCATGYNNDGGWWLGHCIDLTLTANNAIVHDGSQNYVQHEYAELRVRPKSCVVKTTSCSSE